MTKLNHTKILNENLDHSLVADLEGVKKCMDISYNQGVDDVLKWLSNMDYLSDNLKYLVEEWKNQNGS